MPPSSQGRQHRVEFGGQSVFGVMETVSSMFRYHKRRVPLPHYRHPQIETETMLQNIENELGDKVLRTAVGQWLDRSILFFFVWTTNVFFVCGTFVEWQT